mgnify:FL=1
MLKDSHVNTQLSQFVQVSVEMASKPFQRNVTMETFMTMTVVAICAHSMNLASPVNQNQTLMNPFGVKN